MFNFQMQFNTGDSGPAVASIATALDQTAKHGKHAAESIKLFEGEAGKLSGTVGGLTLNLSALSSGGSVFVFDLAEAFRGALELAHKLTETVIDLGKEMIRASAKQETLQLALDFSVGKEKAKELGELAEVFAKATGNDDDFYKNAWLPLLKGGLRNKDQIGILTTASLELAAQNNEGQDAVKGYLSSLGRIALGGKIKEGALKDFGIMPQKFYAVIAAAHRTTMDEAAKLLKSGKLSTDEILATITGQIAANTGDPNSIGSAALARGQTLDATLQKLHDLPENVFKKLAGSDGMVALQGTIENIIRAVEEQAPAALDSLNRVFKGLFGDLNGPDGFEKVSTGIKAMLKNFEDAVPIIVAGGKAIFGALEEVAKIVLTLHDEWPKIANIIRGVSEGALAGAVAGGVATGGVGAIPGLVVGGVAGGIAASKGVEFRATAGDEARRSGYGANQVTQHNTVTIHVDGMGGQGPEEAAKAMEQAAREAQVRIGQELSSHP